LKSNKKKIGITLGDPGGIGPEIIDAALSRQDVKDLAEFIVIDKDKFLGKSDKINAKRSYEYLLKSVELIKNQKIDAIVTGPVSKDRISLMQPFTGQTEFFANSFDVSKQDVGMMFIADSLKVLIATRHIPLKEVSCNITRKKIYCDIKRVDNALKGIFKIKSPVIGICGLNPHAGENGKIGKEELTEIIPAIKQAKQDDAIEVKGPIPADVIFRKDQSKQFDAIIAMYHDQALSALKAMYFNKLVNLTIGLPFIRTSPAHGTAFDIAGKNQADESSMCAAIKLAVKLMRNRKV